MTPLLLVGRAQQGTYTPMQQAGCQCHLSKTAGSPMRPLLDWTQDTSLTP